MSVTEFISAVADTPVFRSAVDLVAEEAVSSGKECYTVINSEKVVREIVSLHLRETIFECSPISPDDYSRTVAIAFFPESLERISKQYESCVFVLQNPVQPWPIGLKLKNRLGMSVASNELWQNVSVTKLASSGGPVYFALWFMANLTKKSTAIHFLLNDFSHRLVVSRGVLAMLGSLLVFRMDRR